MAKRIIFQYYNSFTMEDYGSADLVYNRNKSANGFYSKRWKLTRKFLANQFSVKLVHVHVKMKLI